MTHRVEEDADGTCFVDDDLWYVNDLHERFLRTAGAGPDGNFYCSDSCRAQAMYEALSADHRAALKMMYQATLMLSAARRVVGRVDDTEAHWQTIRSWMPELPDFFWAISKSARDIDQAFWGTADNEQPTWTAEVEA